MPDVMITVREKIAQVSGSPEIVCGNSDYAVVFDLDEEWNAYEIKTMHVVWLDARTGKLRYDDVPFSGSTAIIPAIYDAYEIAVGIYAGDIRTTTPARIPCARCITDGGSAHEPPPPDVYAQILDLLEKIAKPVGFGATGDATMMLDGAGIGIVGIAEYDADTVDLLQEPYLSSLVNGYCNDNTGAVVTPYSSRVCCTEYVEFPADRERMVVDVQISGAAGRWYCYIYDADGNYLKSITSSTDSISGEKYWTHIASGAAREIPSTGAKMRVICRTSSGGDISPSDVERFKVTFYK